MFNARELLEKSILNRWFRRRNRIRKDKTLFDYYYFTKITDEHICGVIFRPHAVTAKIFEEYYINSEYRFLDRLERFILCGPMDSDYIKQAKKEWTKFKLRD